MVRTRLFGGLGNQLFQYFAGLSLSLQNDSIFEIDLRWLEANKIQIDSSIMQFQFAHKFGKPITNDVQCLRTRVERVKTMLIRNLSKNHNIGGLNVPNHPFYVNFDNLKYDIELRGYYQSYKYYNRSRQLLFPVEVDWSLTSASQQYISAVEKLRNENFLGIHVRGNDYLKNRNYEMLNLDYYGKAIENVFRNRSESLKIMIFTDDREYANSIVKSLNIQYVHAPGELTPAETLCLMSESKVLIAANSTFSYWSGLINPNLEMIAPKMWFTNCKLPYDFYPSHWQTI